MAVVEDMKAMTRSQVEMEDRIIVEEVVVVMVLQDKMEEVMRGQVKEALQEVVDKEIAEEIAAREDQVEEVLEEMVYKKIREGVEAMQDKAEEGVVKEIVEEVVVLVDQMEEALEEMVDKIMEG